MSSRSLIRLLIDLGADVKLQEKFKKHPRAFLEGYELSEKEKKGALKALETGDPKYIQDLISDEVKRKHPNVNVNIIKVHTSKE